MLSADASTSPWNRTSPSRPASATATALRSFATSIPTNASLISAMVHPPLVRRGSYHSPGHRGAASLIRVAPHRERTYGLTADHGQHLSRRSAREAYRRVGRNRSRHGAVRAPRQARFEERR